MVSYVDFKKVFKKSDDDLESHIAEGSSSNFEQVMPKTIPELADGNKVTYLIVMLRNFIFVYRILSVFHNSISSSVSLLMLLQSKVEEVIVLSGATLQSFKVKVSAH